MILATYQWSLIWDHKVDFLNGLKVALEVSLVAIVLSGRSQRLGDLAAGTFVVRAPRARLDWASLRTISIWEVHVHNYMATIPLYLLMLIMVLNWGTVEKLVSLDWSGELGLHRLTTPPGGSS